MWRLRTNYHDKSKAHGEEKVTDFTKGAKAVTVQQYKKGNVEKAKKKDGRRKKR
jgi:hypothetical protein